MLILTRKLRGWSSKREPLDGTDTIAIGDKIKVTFMRTNRYNSVAIGFDTPAEVDVYREEVYYRIQREKEQGLIVERKRQERGAK